MYLVDKRLFKSKMYLYGDNGKSLATYLGITQATVSRCLNGRSEFTQSQIGRIKDRYELTAEEVEDIFFTIWVT